MRAIKCYTLLVLVVLPLLFGQMCAVPDPVPGGNDQVPDGNQDEQPPPPPPPTAKTVTGPGFSLVIPAGFDLYQDPATETGFRQTYGNGQRLICVSTETPLPGGPFISSNCVRLEGAQVSDSGDFLLTGAKVTSSDSAEVHAAYALLANGDLLCVEVVGGQTLSAADREFGAGLFRSIVLDDTDGRILEQKLWLNHPKLLGCSANGLAVLEDLTAWIIADELASGAGDEMQAWPRGCAVHVQMVGDAFQLMQVGRWMPVNFRALAVATETSIADYDAASRHMIFANGHSAYVGRAKLPDLWELGDEVLLVRDQSIFWIIWRDSMKAVRIN